MFELLAKHHLVLYPLLPFCGALLGLMSFNINIARNIAILFSIANFLLGLFFNKLSTDYSLGGWSDYRGINFHIWHQSWLLVDILNFIYLFILIFCHKNLESLINNKYEKSKRHIIYSILQLAQSGFIGILITQDFFTLYVFIEISSLSSYVLLSLSKENKRALVASLDYLIVGSIGAVFILLGVGIILKSTGQLNMLIAKDLLITNRSIKIAIAFYIVGALMKLAFFPIHSWMVNAYKNVDITILSYIGSVSSLVSAYILYEFLYFVLSYSFDSSFLLFRYFLYYLSGIIMIFFAYCAYIENNLRKILLFSSSMYAGYFILMIISGIDSNLLLYYISSISIIKLALFYALSILERNNIKSIDSIEGIGFRSKIFSIAYGLIILSNASLPFSLGFIAKILLMKELSSLGNYYALVTIVIASSFALLYNYKLLIPIFRNNIIPNALSINKLEKLGLLIISFVQVLFIFLPNYLVKYEIVNAALDLKIQESWYPPIFYSSSLLYGVILSAIILVASFIKNSYIRLFSSLSLSIIYMCMIGFISYQYFSYSSIESYQIFECKIYHLPFLSFVIDSYSLDYLLLLSVLWPISILYTESYLKNISQQAYSLKNSIFLFCINLCIISSSFIAISGNLVTMFGFYEILSLSTIPLILYLSNDESYKALYRYFILLFIPSTLFFLLAIFLVLSCGNGMSLIYEDGLLQSSGITESNTIFLLVLFILGISKLATFPFLGWLPTSMVAIHPVSGILHGVAVVNSGIFCLIKILIYIFGLDFIGSMYYSQYLLLIPVGTIIFASIMAVNQDSLKKILAYSTITQINIMLAGLLSFTYFGMIGAMIHMVIHSVTKLLLFFKVGDIYLATKSSSIKELKGLSKKMPFTYIAMIIGFLSLSAFPMFPASFTKKHITNSLLYYNDQGFINLYSVWIMTTSNIVTIAYAIKVLLQMRQPHIAEERSIKSLPRIQNLSSFLLIILLMALSIIISFSDKIMTLESLYNNILSFVVIYSYYKYRSYKNHAIETIDHIIIHQRILSWSIGAIIIATSIYRFLAINPNIYYQLAFLTLITLVLIIASLEFLFISKVQEQFKSITNVSKEDKLLFINHQYITGEALSGLMKPYLILQRLCAMINQSFISPLNIKIMRIANPSNINPSIYGALILLCIFQISISW